VACNKSNKNRIGVLLGSLGGTEQGNSNVPQEGKADEWNEMGQESE
jgi:hypothetical protein